MFRRGMGPRTRRWALITLVATLCATPAIAHADSLYTGPGPRPGPDLLYSPATPAPQLTNAAPWQAPPILVSGATAYRDGEFLYQDFLYDDHGAGTGVFDPDDPRGAAGNAFSKPNGTYTYPTDPKYANNAADIVELRVKPLADATAFRLTLNTMKDPSLIAASIAIGGTPALALPFPGGANVKAPADLFLTVHPGTSGMTADLVTAATGTAAPGPAPTVSVDAERRQIEVRVPHASWDPGTAVVRLAAGVGLWDAAAGAYLTPLPAADASHPGGSGGAAAPAAFFNVAFRTNEPVPAIGDVFDTAKSPAWWRDKQQGAALNSGDITAFHADVDFGKLASATDDDSGVPATGPMDRILASRTETAQGADYSVSCTVNENDCTGPYQGRLQPYAVYVPKKDRPARGYGLTLLLHSLLTNYNQFAGSRNQSEFGERGGGSIVITPEARGPDGNYASYAAADVFEVWADVARHYRLDPDWTSIAGYSMGGIGTFKLAEQFPDLFARAQPTVGDSSNTDMIPSLRNIPVLMWNGAADELVNPALYLPTAAELDRLGYRYELDVFAPGEHNSLAINDEFDQAAAFLGTATVDRDPPHVAFVASPALDLPKLDYVSDHAYWLSGVKPRDEGATGRIDVLSHGFGEGEPDPGATQSGAGMVTGGNLLPEYPFTRRFKEWGDGPATDKQDVLDVSASNVSTVTVHTARARVSCAAKLFVETDGPLDVLLGGCGGAAKLPAARRCVDRRNFSFKLHHARGARVVRVAAFVNGHRKLRRRGRDIKRITLQRLPRRKFTVRIVATQSTGSKLVSTRRYKGCRKGRPRTRAHHHPR
jgi:C-terminal binding-module, SLH-like, of glucodextranase